MKRKRGCFLRMRGTPLRTAAHPGCVLRTAIAALSALLTLAVGIVSAADVRKLPVCWMNEQANNDYECEQGCYFEEDPLDDSNAAQCTSPAEHELDIEYIYRDNPTDTAGLGCDGGCITIGSQISKIQPGHHQPGLGRGGRRVEPASAQRRTQRLHQGVVGGSRRRKAHR